MMTRRRVLGVGGAFIAELASPAFGAPVNEVVEIRMRGNSDGSQVWFEPAGVHIEPGQLVRWINADPGNSHTSTAYHPKNDDRPLRIPKGADPWDSDYLLPDQRFEVTLTVAGVYDYFCTPHEQASMVGRIVVGRPHQTNARRPDRTAGSRQDQEPAFEIAESAFPTVAEILRKGRVNQH